MGKKILVVEDDTDLLGIYAEILQLNGYDVITASNGQEAILAFKNNSPNLVVMDGDMPILDGFEAFSKIKEINKNANVIIVTGYSDFDKKSKIALQNGLISIISKPISLEMLLDIAKKYCSEIVMK